MKLFILALLVWLPWIGEEETQGEQISRFPPIAWESIQEGDILFQNLDCGPLCDAIEAVTQGAGGRDFSHCGLVVKRGEEWGVLEAYGSVRFTSLDSFRLRKQAPGHAGTIILGRLKESHRHLAAPASKRSQQYLGRPYDSAFLMDSPSLYCSELVYEAYRDANQGEPVFPLAPMEFREPGSADFMDVWKHYYRELGVPIPQGVLGINPGSISRSPHLDLFEMMEDEGGSSR